MRRPKVAVLREHVRLLEFGGTVVISVPNFRYYSVARDLFVRGHVRYTDSGILDRTHLRVTTRRMVEEWLNQVGLTRAAFRYRIAMRRERMLNSMSLGVLSEFLARQVIVVAVKQDAPRTRPRNRLTDAPASFDEAFIEMRQAR